MSQTDIPALISQGEGANLEFKRDDVRPETLAKEVVAFANMNGGQILLGVEDDGGISGIQKDNLQEWLMDVVIGRYVAPYIRPDCEEVSVDGNKVAVIGIPMGTAKPYTLQHQDRTDIYVRYGNVCRLADRAQAARLFQSGGDLSAEKFPVHGAQLDELDERRYQYYFEKILKDNGEINERFLKNRGFLVGEEDRLYCSYFSYALFSLKPGIRLPQAPVRVTVFPGLDKDYDMTLDEMLDVAYVPLQSHLGTLELAVHEKAIDLLQPFISKEQMVGTRRQRAWDYPPDAIRETLINGLIHRDWTKPDYVRVEAYKDRLVIQSPGALPNGMTVEAIKSGARLVRNQEFARVFRDYGYLEDLGMGIRRKVIPLCIAHNKREPDFEATQDHFKVTLYK
ncbi:MAG: RNA-binding domain-containing protein [Pseudomonadales bacterium]